MIIISPSSGCLSCEGSNLLGLHQLHRGALWIIKRPVGTYLWSGNLGSACNPSKYFFFSFVSSFWHQCCLFVQSSDRLSYCMLKFYEWNICWHHGSFTYLIYCNTCMQMILILTKSVNRCFERNPKFDMTSLLGGTDVVFSSLIHSFGWLVSALLTYLYVFLDGKHQPVLFLRVNCLCSFLKCYSAYAKIWLHPDNSSVIRHLLTKILENIGHGFTFLLTQYCSFCANNSV